MCDEAVDDSLATLKLVLDWFVTSKMIKSFIILMLLFLLDFWLEY